MVNITESQLGDVVRGIFGGKGYPVTLTLIELLPLDQHPPEFLALR